MQNETGVHKCGEMCQFKTLPVSTLGQWKKFQPWVSGGDEAGGSRAGFAKEAGKPGSKLRSVQTPGFFINIDSFLQELSQPGTLTINKCVRQKFATKQIALGIVHLGAGIYDQGFKRNYFIFIYNRGRPLKLYREIIKLS